MTDPARARDLPDFASLRLKAQGILKAVKPEDLIFDLLVVLAAKDAALQGFRDFIRPPQPSRGSEG